MAIITISRKIASYGDETAMALSRILGYTFVDRKMIEQELVKKGVSENQLKKYDERKPGFLASLSRERDEYFDRLRETVYEYASHGNSIFIGRGCFALLKDVPGTYNVRLTAPDHIRIARLMNEFNHSEKQAKLLLAESDENRGGFHKCFFNTENDDAAEYHLVINTGCTEPETAAEIIRFGMEKTVCQADSKTGIKRSKELLLGQHMVNLLSFELKLPIYFLEAEVFEDRVILHGVADNCKTIEKAAAAAKTCAEGKTVISSLNLISNVKSVL